MNSDDLTTEQTSRLYEALFPHVNYLVRLKKRLEDLRFPEDDPLRVAASQAYDAAWRLSREAHSMSVRMGCGRRVSQVKPADGLNGSFDKRETSA